MASDFPAVGGSRSPQVLQAVRRVLRASRRHLPLVGRLSLGLSVVVPGALSAAELPVCISGACGNPSGFVTAGAAGVTVNGNVMTVNQTTPSATLNWQSFNIGADGTVNFVQPDANSIALNRVLQGGASFIAGTLSANGRVYLINQNGIVFGEGAKVDVAGLIASSLDITPVALEAGIANAVTTGEAAFRAFDNGSPTGNVSVARGATLATPEGGQIMLFAPNVTNEGTIRTPGGQTLIAAGSPVYLASSSDPNLRGLLVEVGTGGTVTNGNTTANTGVIDPAQLLGQIVAERGNVTLAGLAVNQSGRVTATTTVKENGSIRLQAREGGTASSITGLVTGNNGGTLTVGANSHTEVQLSTDLTERAVDSTAQPASQILLEGRRVLVLEEAQVRAAAGTITLAARANPAVIALDGSTNDGSRIYLAAGATLDVAGADVTLAMERNVVTAELRGNELADSPAQRDGSLRGETVYVDSRTTGTREDGSEWQGTPLGDVSGQISLVERNVQERNLRGGTVVFESQGDVIVASGATIDISGGSITYESGYINTTRLVGADGRIYDIADADPARVYTGTTSGTTYSVTSQRWGITRDYDVPGSLGRFESGYVEGKDAGLLRILTPRAILDGNVLGEVTVGRYQRELAEALANGQIYRSFDQLPLGAQLVMGRVPQSGSNDRLAGSIVLVDGDVLPSLVNGDGSPFDPVAGDLPAGFTVTRLQPRWFGRNGITRVVLNSNGSLELPATVALDLGGQGSFDASARSINAAGQVRAASGTIALRAGETSVAAGGIGIELAASTVLDVSGLWINESVLLNAPGSPLPPLLVDGGQIAIFAEGGSVSMPGGVLDVSAGARALANGTVLPGSAGTLSIEAQTDLASVDRLPVSLSLGAELRGYGLASGGTLSLAAPGVCIGEGEVCTPADARTLVLAPGTFTSGFAAVEVASNELGLDVAAGTELAVQQRNFVLRDGALDVGSGVSLASIADVALLPEHQRLPASLALAANVADLAGGIPYTNLNFGDAPGLTVHAGALITGDTGAAITLGSNSTLVVAGEVQARAGDISLVLDNSLLVGETLDAQGIWLDAGAVLDVSGTTLLVPNDLGLRSGSVLDAGSVSMRAERGAVITGSGSTINLSGAAAEIDFVRVPGTALEATAALIASDGGHLAITAAEAVVLGGTLEAAPGSGSATARGGMLSVTLDANDRLGDTTLLLPVEERRITLDNSVESFSVAPRSALPDAAKRGALLSADAIESAGFTSLELAARTTEGLNQSGTQFIRAGGVVELADGLDLDLGHQVVIDAARITGAGSAAIDAPYVRIGHADAAKQDDAVPGVAGSGALTVSGQFVEVIGRSVVDGFGTVTLDSSGDLRLRGIQQPGEAEIVGALQTSADLLLRADQVYATTLSDFTIEAGANGAGRLRIETTGEPRGDVLSAGSHLTFRAPVIEQAGVVRAPFGTIDFVADDLRLEAGSLTSTSAQGAIIPFGSIQAGAEWVYSLGNLTLVVGETLDLPSQTIALDGERVSVAAGATIDVSGGGDLLAYEFIPGTTGTRDVLSALEAPGRFAVVPGLRLEQAPYDPQEAAGTGLKVGDSVHLSADAAGLPAGDYVLLPARYALLEGAFLIEGIGGYTDLPTGESLLQADGSTVVSGYRRTIGTQFADARTSGFAVRAGSTVAADARYDVSLASEFFSADDNGRATTQSRLPQDAGILSLSAETALDIDGTLRAIAMAGGRGAGVDISAANLVVSDSAVGGAGEVVVSAASLSALGAESVFLGGRRSSGPEGTTINVAAESVAVDAGTVLSAPELILAATDTVSVAAATLTASGTVQAESEYIVAGDGALLRLAASGQVAIDRRNETGAAGTLVLEEGATLVAVGGALALDASLDTRSAAALSLAGGSLSLGASIINLGEPAPGTPGLALDVEEINALGLRELALTSRSAIDLHGNVVLAVEGLVLDAAALRAQQVQGDASINADGQITLANRQATTVADAAAGNGSLTLSADRIVVGSGVQRISGFDAVTVAADTMVVGRDTGRLEVAGDLRLVTPLVTAATGAATVLRADGDLQVDSLLTASTPAREAAGLGAALSLEAATVRIDSRIETAAGNLIVSAAGDVLLGSEAILSAAGVRQDFDGTLVAAPAGDIVLESEAGSVIAQAGSLIDVSGAGGVAGSLAITASAGQVELAGSVSGTAGIASDSGRVSIDGANLGNLTALNATLAAGGFDAARSFRQRGSGDLRVEAGQTVRGEQVVLTADQGRVIVDGAIDADSAARGRVTLSGRDGIEIAGVVSARSGSDEGRGGIVRLHADEGGIVIGATGVIAAGNESTGTGGDLELRLHRDRVLTLTDLIDDNEELVLAGSLSGLSRTTVEAFARYSDTDLGLIGGVITAAQVSAMPGNVLYDDAVNFMAGSADVVAALGRTGDAGFRLLPGIEIQSAGDLLLGADGASIVNWDLSQWRFGGAPGVLTLRAAGNLVVNGSLSDGFTGVTGANATAAAFRLTATTDSWSYRLVAGADASSADLLAVTAGASGDFTITGGTAPTNATNPGTYRMVRTGNGYIDVATAGDFVLTNSQSMLYTAGVAATDGISPGNSAQGLGTRLYPEKGGDISIRAGGDIEGAQSTQLVTDWLWRTGRSAEEAPTGLATAWTVNFARFQQNVAALGGGDVDISAQGDIRNFSASIPSIGKQVGSAQAGASVVTITGGGTLDVSAGRNIEGGSFFVGRGSGRLDAGGDIGTSRYTAVDFTEYDLYPVLALGDASWDLGARGTVGMETVVNPTLLPVAPSQFTNLASQSWFSTYSPDSIVRAQSVAGDVVLSNNEAGLAGVLTTASLAGGNSTLLQVYAPSLEATAFSGDLLLNGRMTLFPAAGSTLELLAAGNITRADPARTAILRQLTADPAFLPSLATPRTDATRLLEVINGVTASGLPSANLHAATSNHAGDDSIAHLVARSGDIDFEQSGEFDTATSLSFGMPARLVAGGDIVDLPLAVQHDDAGDVSSVIAGGSLRYTVTRNETGTILTNARELVVDGPGTLLFTAGRDIDLQTSTGISTRGNLVNTLLPDRGADITLLAGVDESAIGYDAMTVAYLEETGEYGALLVEYVGSRTGTAPANAAEALVAFRSLTRAEQRPLLEAVLIAELRASAIEAASADPERNGNYSRGFAALSRLFPGAGANPEEGTAAASAYLGDIALYFSRVYSRDGGDITLLAPGGGVNVGLASPPSSFGIAKNPDELGIVSQRTGDISIVTDGDVLVNESRVFAIDDSDILVWSSNGDVDAGRGAKTAISAPAAVITYDRDGFFGVTYSAALAGSGIQARATTSDSRPGDVVLAAPRGVVNAGDAGIVAGNLTIAATAVLGADNIQVSGAAVGVPVDTGGLGAALAGVTAAASGASAAAGDSVAPEASEQADATPLTESALSWLDVFVIGLGEEDCAPADTECLQRQGDEAP